MAAKTKKPDKAAQKANNHVVATNRKARHNYSILETFEAGIVLVGTEVKSLREGQASLVDAFATVDDGEVWLRNLHIAEYHHGTWTNHAPRRNRKLLLHRRQIDTLVGKIRDGNLTLVPLSLYFVDGKVKVELALARGKEPATSGRTWPSGMPTGRSPANWAGAPRACADRRRARVGLGRGLRGQRLRRGIASRRVAALRVVLVSYPVALVLLTALSFVVGGHVSARPCCGAVVRDKPGFRGVVVSTPRWGRDRSRGVPADGDPGGRGAGRRRGGLGSGPARWRYWVSRWRWSRWCWCPVGWPMSRLREENPVPMRTPRRTGSPRRWAWLTVGSGLAFGLNSC
jgi:SsrA-binding protein